MVGRMPGFAFVKRNHSVTASEIFLVAEDTTNGRLAVVTGTFVIEFKTDIDALAFASKHELSIESFVPHLRSAFLKSKRGTDLTSKLSELQADPLIKRAELEVLDHQDDAK